MLETLIQNLQEKVKWFIVNYIYLDPSHSMAPPTNMKLIKKHENAFSDFSYVPEKNMNQNY